MSAAVTGDGARRPRVRTLLILGASGDLTARLLLPGLATLLAERPGDGLTVAGAGRADWDDDRWRERIARSFAEAGADGAVADRVERQAVYRRADVTDAAELAPLLELGEEPLAIYFALPPAVTWGACCALREVGVPPGSRLVLEKSFGTDLASAERLNRLLLQLVPEDRIHRVDHFLGMATVLNVLGVRFANRMLEPVLGSAHVESVEVVYDETLALEGRAGYYDHAGALVDMLQSHLLQVLALVAMEPPVTLEPVTLEGAYGRGELLEYGQVLRGVLEGDPPLSVRGDAAVESWRIVEPVLAAWLGQEVPLEEYAAGGAGPAGWPV